MLAWPAMFKDWLVTTAPYSHPPPEPSTVELVLYEYDVRKGATEGSRATAMIESAGIRRKSVDTYCLIAPGANRQAAAERSMPGERKETDELSVFLRARGSGYW